MSKREPILVALVAVANVALAVALGAARPGAAARPELAPAPLSDAALRKSHRATAPMIARSDRAAGRAAPSFRAVASDGKAYALADLNADWPVVLVFIKDGCPCSKSAEPYFQRLHAAGGGWVPFLGVIDGDEAVAARWVADNGTPFPILADPDKTIIQSYKAESSAYVALVAPGGKVERLWAGYSSTMFRELTDAMARLSGKPVEPIEAPEAPDELYSGCPFD